MNLTRFRRWLRRRHPEGSGERGAVLVEAAIGLPLMAALGFGIIVFGQAYSNASITAGATRTGARVASASYAPAAYGGTASAQATIIATSVASDLANLSNGAVPVKMWMYKAASATGLPSNGAFTTCPANCISWTWNTSTKAWGTPSGSWPSPQGCTDPLDYVGIYVQVTDPLNTGLFGTRTITMNQRTTMRIEPVSDLLCS